MIMIWKKKVIPKNIVLKTSSQSRTTQHNSCQTPSLEFGFGTLFFAIFVFSKIEKTQFLSRDGRLAAERWQIVLRNRKPK
jgi:hypothetical protein